MPIPTFRLDGRTAIVTGASSGLGDRFARALHEAGANVVVAARRLDRLERLVKELDVAVAVGCDVTVDADLVRLLDTAVERFGTVDVLVNNAGMTHVVPALDETRDQFEQVLDVNLTAAWRLAQLVAPRMMEQGAGSIINVSSVLGLVGAGQIPQSGYSASKAGLIGLTRELGAQWARKGVRVNAIAPGWFESEMTEDMTTDEDAGLRWIRGRTPMGRPGLVHELDGALLFLASDASSFITGHTIAVDGGWTIV
jgi:NAD(P)-dependent dehydrogenase (short-subunit alcohol dehydrogenase family)